MDSLVAIVNSNLVLARPADWASGSVRKPKTVLKWTSFLAIESAYLCSAAGFSSRLLH